MQCPKCGSEMVIKTARKGKLSGKQFYGCSRYPACNAIVDLVDNQSNNNLPNNFNNIIVNNTADFLDIDTPVFLKAREKFPNYQVRFFETIAVPKEFLEYVFLDKIKRNDIRWFNQWRLDFPASLSVALNGEQKQIFLVAHKILTRGRITQTSPYIEKSLKQVFGIDDNSILDFLDPKYLNITITKNDLGGYFLDGFGTEQKFFHDILLKYLGEKHVLPQVQLSSLIGNDVDQADNMRVDFLIAVENKKIVVELEGAEHSTHSDSDNLREKLLTQNGFEVFRIKNEEIQNQVGVNLQRLLDTLPQSVSLDSVNLPARSNFLMSVKIIHQVQLTILEAILNGFIDFKNNFKIYFDFDSLQLDENLQLEILKIAEADLKEVLKNLCLIYEVEIEIDSFEILKLCSDNPDGIALTYNSGLVTNKPKFIIQDIVFPFSIAQLDRPVNYAILNNPKVDSIKYFLNYIFRYEGFREGQLEAILRALKGDDSIVLLPTGAGKSVSFQLASMILPGVTIVIDPLVSLIDDQLENLKRIGIDRTVGITAQINDPMLKSRIIKIFGQGEYLFCYIAPERFQTQEFRDTLKSLTVSTPVSIIVIDEAHCVSEWGHNFRTSYLNIGRTSREYCKYMDHTPPLLALTGTASNSVLRDVQRELQIENIDAIITPKTFDRQELFFYVYESTSDQKFTILKGILQRVLPQNFNLTASSFYQSGTGQTHSGIIFCPHRTGSFGVVEISQQIKQQIGIDTKFYAGGKPKQWNKVQDWNHYKKITAKEFKVNSFPLLVATKSFGMGIDKPNIRYTIHYGLPSSIEAFYQEAGRAGRDRKRAECYILLSNDQINRTQAILEPSNKIEDLNTILQKERNWDNDDDITRAGYFHLNAFKGLANELADLKIIIQVIKNLELQRKVSVIFNGLDRNSAEKSIHRLLTLGVIEDYTINYSNNEFTIKLSGIDKDHIIETYCKYVSGYNKGRVRIERQKIAEHADKTYEVFVIEAGKVLLEFIYDTIEKGRRRALREILTLAESAKNKSPEESNQIIRERLLKYFETSYSEEIEEILNESGTFNSLRKIVEGEVVTETGEIIGGIRSRKDAIEIRGQVSRYLESYPDQPGLLFLRSISELFAPDSEKEIITQNILAAINFSVERYSINKDILYQTLCWILSLINSNSNELYKEVVTNILYELNNTNFAKKLIAYAELEENMIYQPGVYLFSRYAQNINSLYK